MRLVDADYIKESVKRQCDNCRKEGMKRMADSVERAIIEELDNTPTAQPERKKGKWILETYQIRCSHCNKLFSDYLFPSNYCPNCGADMRGDSDV